MQTSSEYLSKSQLARVFNVTHSTVIRWIFDGKVPSIVEIGNKSFIPVADIPEIKHNVGYIDLDNYVSLDKFLQLFNIEHQTYLNWIKRGWVKEHVRYGKKVYIPLNSIDEIKKVSGYVHEDDYISVKQLSNTLNVTQEKILRFIKSGLLADYFHYKDKYLFKLDSIAKIKQSIGYNDSYDPNNYLCINQVKEKIGLNIAFYYWKEKIPHILHLGKPYIHTKDLNHISHLIKGKKAKVSLSNTEIIKFENARLENYVDTKMAADLLNITRVMVLALINTHEIKGAIQVLYNKSQTQLKWMIPMESIDMYKQSRISMNVGNASLDEPEKTFTFEKLENNVIPGLDNYVNTKKAAEILQINQGTVSVLINTGKIQGASKVPVNKSQNIWMIPIESINNYIQYRISITENKTSVIIPDNTISLKYLSEKTKVSYKILKQSLLNIQKIKGIYVLPIEEANHFMENYRKHNYDKKVDIYTNKDALEELLDYITVFPLPFQLRNTAELFKEFCTIKMSKLRGIPSHIRCFFNYYKFVFETLRTLDKNLHELDINAIDSLIYEKMTHQHTKRIIVSFYYYCYSTRGLPVPKQYVISKVNTTSTKEKEIYSPESFSSFYRYVKNLTLHLPNAISNPYYANMWAFTIMHLTNAWRASDIVFKTPNIDISSIQIDSFNWFNHNALTITQCQKVINYLYLHFRSIKTSKTSAFVTFLVEPELVEPLATALIISELHRQKNKDSYLLQSFIIGTKIKTVYTSGKTRHQDFFKWDSSLDPFKSLKFNNSTMTYLFYSISNEDGNDSDVALELTQRVRSHNWAETTAIYVQATNKDGSLDQVSSNLFRRGHFGWLYNYLVLLASEKDATPRTMEDKTIAISAFRNQIGSPVNTEEWAQYLLQIQQKRSSVMSRLATLSKDSLLELLVKIFNGEMASKTENAQCLTSPKCEYQRLNSCYSCPNIIPKNYLFIELRGEFDRLTTSIETTEHDVIRKKESYFLLNLLLLFDEGIKFFGEEYIEAFLNVQYVREKLRQLADKIYIE